MVLQHQLLDEEARAGAAGISGGRGLSGQQWYVQQGLRAVNQAMGRVIRHRWDYGAVLLADERFGSAQNKRHLSRWLREQVTSHSSFGGAIGSLTKFFKNKRHLSRWLREQVTAHSSFGGAIGSLTKFFKNKRHLSRWLREQVTSHSSFGDAIGSLTKFFKNKRHLSRWLREQVTAHSSFGGAIGSLTKFFKDKGDIAASAAAARAAGPAAAASNAACPSAFQLIGGAEGQPGQGSRAAARSAAAEQQQRRQQLMAVPRAVDVLGLIGREEGGSSGAAAAAAAAAGPGSQLDSLIADMLPAEEAARSKLQQQQQLKHKQRQLAAAGDGTADAAADAQQQQQQQQQQGKGKPPLRMGQFLKQWNSTQIEQQKQQAQELEQQQQQQQQQVEKQQQQKHSAEHQKQQVPDAKQRQQQDQQFRDQQQQQQQQQEVAAAAPASALDPKSFFKLLHEQLQPQQMAAVKALLTAYKASRDLSAFVDGLIAELGASSSSGSSSRSHLLLEVVLEEKLAQLKILEEENTRLRRHEAALSTAVGSVEGSVSMKAKVLRSSSLGPADSGSSRGLSPGVGDTCVPSSPHTMLEKVEEKEKEIRREMRQLGAGNYSQLYSTQLLHKAAASPGLVAACLACDADTRRSNWVESVCQLALLLPKYDYAFPCSTPGDRFVTNTVGNSVSNSSSKGSTAKQKVDSLVDEATTRVLVCGLLHPPPVVLHDLMVNLERGEVSSIKIIRRE
ncbi:hypothetical protein OEZ85_013818 [Tetradesmus obliquus]|uniref:ATP-dependent helicase C-terminal domain-containing protein n=1 Tax=Tetradesmus obliquus TaxID=3088 RepID=A0ABY8U9Z6_TETOB|nr:hypothetical protein OEZ85_013818 [Tetradesmus obliquus]